MLHAEVALFEVLAKLRNDSREDEVLRIRLEVRDVDDVHGAVAEVSERQIAHRAVVGDQPAAARGDIGEAIAHFADRRDMVRAPRLGVLLLHSREQIAEPALEFSERLHAMCCGQVLRVGELLVNDALLDEIDERVGLRVDVVFVQRHLRVLEHFAKSPRERRDVVRERRVGPQRVQRVSLRGVRREVFDVLERLGGHAEALVQRAIGVVEFRRRLIEEAEIGALHVEAHGRHAPFLLGEVREDRREQPLDRARLGREARYAADVEVRRLRPEQKIRVEPHRRRRRARAIQPDRNARARSRREIRVHSQCDGDVFVAREMNSAHRHRLERFLGNVPEYGGRVQANLGAARWCARVSARFTVVAEHLVQRRLDVRVTEPLDDHAVHPGERAADGLRALDAHDGSDADRRIERRPEMEFVRSIGFPLSCDYAAENRQAMEDVRCKMEGLSGNVDVKDTAEACSRFQSSAFDLSSYIFHLPSSIAVPLPHRRPQILLAITYPVRHRAPATVRERDGRALGEHPARDFVGAVAAPRVARDFHAHQSKERIAAARIAEPEIPARDGGPARGTDLERRGARARVERGDDAERAAVGIQRAVRLHDADGERTLRRASSTGDPAIDEQRIPFGIAPRFGEFRFEFFAPPLHRGACEREQLHRMAWFDGIAGGERIDDLGVRAATSRTRRFR